MSFSFSFFVRKLLIGTSSHALTADVSGFGLVSHKKSPPAINAAFFELLFLLSLN